MVELTRLPPGAYICFVLAYVGSFPSNPAFQWTARKRASAELRRSTTKSDSREWARGKGWAGGKMGTMRSTLPMYSILIQQELKEDEPKKPKQAMRKHDQGVSGRQEPLRLRAELFESQCVSHCHCH